MTVKMINSADTFNLSASHPRKTTLNLVIGQENITKFVSEIRVKHDHLNFMIHMNKNAADCGESFDSRH